MPIVFVTGANNKAKFENSYLDRDRTPIFCDKNQKIGQAIIKYNRLLAIPGYLCLKIN